MILGLTIATYLATTNLSGDWAPVDIAAPVTPGTSPVADTPAPAEAVADTADATVASAAPFNLDDFLARLRAETGLRIQFHAMKDGRIQFEATRVYTADELNMTAEEYARAPAWKRERIVGVFIVDTKNPDASVLMSTLLGDGGGKASPDGTVLTVRDGQVVREPLKGPDAAAILSVFKSVQNYLRPE